MSFGISSTLQSQYSPFANLNLTSTQQTQITSLLQTDKTQGASTNFAQVQSQIKSVLTPSQQQTFQNDVQNLKQQHSGHHHHHGGGGESSSTADVLSPAYDVQNQAAAADSVNQTTLQNELLQFGSATT
jgi:Spy/CpxP family protein refolding chaperone